MNDNGYYCIIYLLQKIKSKGTRNRTKFSILATSFGNARIRNLAVQILNILLKMKLYYLHSIFSSVTQHKLFCIYIYIYI